ncbi:MAG: AMP-binding protein, partial [Actinomycetota bacterium]|nr:AMP-binding protein [Actinomycetota bacterium]
VGRALPDVEVKIVDMESGEEAGTGEQGDLCTRGYHVMKGYYKMPEETQEVIDEDGWLHTGDLATMDEDGYVQIMGRVDDMIIRGGENIYPREIEEFLYTHPEISDVQVYGVPENASLTEEDVKEYCRENIARHKVPEYVDFVDEYPMTASGKIQKYRLRETAIEHYDLVESADTA